GAIRLGQIVGDVGAFFQDGGAGFIRRTGDADEQLVSERPDLHRDIALSVFVDDLHFDGSDAGFAAEKTRYPFHGLTRLLIVGSMRGRRQAHQCQPQKHRDESALPAHKSHSCPTLRPSASSFSTSTAPSASGAPIARPMGMRTRRLKAVTANDRANRSSLAANREKARVKTN